jgi:hypothetical protein
MRDQYHRGKHIFGGGRRQYRTGRNILLVKTFVEPDGMRGGRMQRRRPGYRGVILMAIDKTRIMKEIPGVGVAFEIIKGLYGKENTIHPKKQGVKK